MRRTTIHGILFSTSSFLALAALATGASATITIGPGQTWNPNASTAEDIIDNGTIYVSTNDITLSGNISGSGDINVSRRTLGLTGTNTFTGTAIVNNGTLRIGNGSTAGALIGSVSLYTTGISDVSSVIFNRSDTYRYTGNVNGSWITGLLRGDAIVCGGGTMIYTGVNTAHTTIESGNTLQVGDGGSTGSLLYVNNYGTLIFNQSGTVDVATGIYGSGTVILRGGATYVFNTLILSNNWFAEKLYTGDTVIEHATLQAGTSNKQFPRDISPNSRIILKNAADANFVVAGVSYATWIPGLYGGGPDGGNTMLAVGAQLIITQGGNYAGAISGGGQFEVSGGTQILSGTNSYSGGTTVDSGAVLQLGDGGASGSITGNVLDNGMLAVNRSGTLTLQGVISGAGTLQKSGSGVLILNGTNGYTGLTSVAAGTLEIGDAAHSSATVAGDVMVAAGATLSGHGRVFGSVANSGTVSPGGSLGTLTVGDFIQDASGTLAIEVGPGGTSVLNVTHAATLGGRLAITVAPAIGVWQSESFLTASTITGAFASVTVSAPATHIYALDYATNAIAFTIEDRKAGQLYSDLVSTVIDGAHALNGMLAAHRPECSTAACSGVSVWANVFGSRGWFDAATSAADPFDVKRAGMVAGVDYTFAGGESIGVAAAFSQSAVTVSHGWGSALLNSVSGAVSGAASLWLGAIKIGAFGTANIASSRRELGSSGIAYASPDGYAFGGAVEYGVSLLQGDVVPLVGISVIQAQMDGVAESGAGALALQQESDNHTSARGELGLRLQHLFATGSGVQLIPHLRLSLQQELHTPDEGASLELVGHPDTQYRPAFAGSGPSAFAATVGLDIAYGQSWKLHLSGSTRISARERQAVIGLGGTFRF